jgi:uracil-DNA glycosylase family 4
MGLIDRCPGCPYAGKAIGTRGDPASPIVLVGEAPGVTEIERGQPFVGTAATTVLWPAVAEAGLRETELYVVNSVACRPFNPETSRIRTPSPRAVGACHERFVADMGTHSRGVIVALGATAVRALTGRRAFPVTKTPRGTQLPSAWGTVVPTLHPAYVLRRGLDGPEWQRLVEALRHAGRRSQGST